jgi:hypothetical protein
MLGLLEEASHLGGLGDVRLERERPLSERLYLARQLGRAGLLLAEADDDGVATPGQLQHHGSADSA